MLPAEAWPRPVPLGTRGKRDLGGDLGKGSIFDKYRVTDQFPAMYLLDSRGKIVYRTAGEDIAGLKRALASLGIQ